jgi:Fe-S cluster assembly scaffold protein SufB
MKLLLLDPQANHQLSPEEDTLCLLLLDQKARQGTAKVDLSFKTSGVTCRLLFIGRLAAQSTWQLESNMHHLTDHTSCQTDVYLSQADASRVDYFGQIHIARNARDTKSFLKEQSLTLGRATFNRSRPILEIFNNKVKASHSASSSRLNESDLFYLMSRGFDRQEAEKILEEAFFNQIIDTVKSSQAKKMIKDYLC